MYMSYEPLYGVFILKINVSLVNNWGVGSVFPTLENTYLFAILSDRIHPCSQRSAANYAVEAYNFFKTVVIYLGAWKYMFQ